MLDKIKGGLFGVAIGDALGATTEFMSRGEIEEQYGYLTEITGGGWLNLKPGETTDDTELTIAVANGLMKNPDNPLGWIGDEIKKWVEKIPGHREHSFAQHMIVTTGTGLKQRKRPIKC